MVFKYKTLTPEVMAIAKEKKTEKPFSGKTIDHYENGSYLCRGCGGVLFRGNSQFHSGCGWPSFDEDVPNSIKRILDADGYRTEIVCANCDAHLGHVFTGEQFTEKNTRFCVNSLVIEFTNSASIIKTEEAIVAGGCFWGVQHLFNQLAGVLITEVGYTDGETSHPTYQDVCSYKTGHVEAVRIVFDSNLLSYESVLRYFFEIHNPTQNNGQGPDIGSQYLSRIFYLNDTQKTTAEAVKKTLVDLGLSIATEIKPANIFWPAEEYHQHYYQKNKQAPYCHQWTKRF